MFSILIPTYNNLEYLKLCINSINKNSIYKHQIIVHINEGSDGTVEYLKNSKFDFTYSKNNIGMSAALNEASKLAINEYILISHDDFYYCPGWDDEFKKEINLLNHKYFYLSGTMIGAVVNKNIKLGTLPAEFNAGTTCNDFNETKLLTNIEKIKTYNFQGSTKHPALVHKDIWKNVGGWSEEFFPTGGDDSDFNMKLWKAGVRIFKGLGKSLVYHFGSITTRRKDKKFFTYLGSKGNRIFLKKWGISINFFEKHYLKSGIKKKSQIFNYYDGPLNSPNKNINYYFDLIKNKIYLIYIIAIKFK